MIAGSETAAWLAAALMAGFAATMVGAILRGRAGAPCACFGARSTVGWAAVARNALLAAAFAALPALPEGDLSTDEWLGLGLAVALLACAGLAVAVLALAREVGMLRLRLGPEGALEIAEEGPALFSRTGLVAALRARSGGDPGAGGVRLRGCRVCDALEPSIRVARRATRWSRSRASRSRPRPSVWRELGIPGSPFAVALDREGTVLAKGTFNNLAQLESVLAAAERRRAERELAGGRSVSEPRGAGAAGRSAAPSTRSPARPRAAASSPGSAARSPRSPPAAWSPRRSSRARPTPSTSAATSTPPAPACTRPACRGSTATATR